MRTSARFLLLTLILIFGCQTAKDESARPFEPEEISQKLVIEVEGQDTRTLSYSEIYSDDLLVTVQHDDSLFDKPRIYEGLNLESLKSAAEISDQHEVLKVTCRDGFESEVPLSTLEKGLFLLAVRDVAAAPQTFVPYEKMSYLQNRAGELTEKLRDDSLGDEERDALSRERDHLQTLSRDLESLGDQGPFYPIFKDEELPPEDRWLAPFCVEKISFRKKPTDVTLALPEGLPEDHPVVRGSELFQQRCSTCHAVNGIGGQVGPELNRPMNITEYWREPALRQMLKDPKKVRENSKMPAFHLKDPMIDDILAYLRWMGANKKAQGM